jgi:hypothetical protein
MSSWRPIYEDMLLVSDVNVAARSGGESELVLFMRSVASSCKAR